MSVEVGPPVAGDAFGMALVDMVGGAAKAVVIERDDGWIDVDAFNYLDAMPERDVWALARARGQVLDIGAGSGRIALALQDRGHEVTALEVSPGAAEACRLRGVRDVYLGSVREAAAGGLAGNFGTALMLGNNLSLLASGQAAGPMFDALGALLRPGGVIIGTCLDPYQSSKQVHLDYQDRNRRRGRMPGQLRFRVRYQQFTSDWFDWLTMSSAELAALAARSGWQITDLLPGPVYAAVLSRTGISS